MRSVSCLPPRLPLADRGRVLVVHAIAGERRVELLQRDARIGHQRQAAVLVGVELGDVDVDEAHVGILEGGLRGGGEIAEARADARSPGRPRAPRCSRQGAGDADGAEILRMVERQRALAGLRFAHRNTVCDANAPAPRVASL